MCWRQFAALWGDYKISQIAPLNAIIIMEAHSHHGGFAQSGHNFTLLRQPCQVPGMVRSLPAMLGLVSADWGLVCGIFLSLSLGFLWVLRLPPLLHLCQMFMMHLYVCVCVCVCVCFICIVQCNWACSTWKRAIETKLLLSLLLYWDWVRQQVGPATSISVEQPVQPSQQICLWDTPACCWGVKQATNQHPVPHKFCYQ